MSVPVVTPALSLSITCANPLLDRPSAFFLSVPATGLRYTARPVTSEFNSDTGSLLEPPRRGGVQMTANAIAGQALVAGLDGVENPQVSVVNGKHVRPGRGRLPGARPVPAEQLDDDPKKEVQQRVAGQLRQSDAEPDLLGGGRADIAGLFAFVVLGRGPMAGEKIG